MGFDYLFQPLLSQQLGVFSTDPVIPGTTDEFLKAIPLKYKLIEITLNARNKPGPDFTTKRHTTCLLNLNQPYQKISANYSENTRRNLSKASLGNLRFRTNTTVSDFIGLLGQDRSIGARELMKGKNRPVLEKLAPALLNHQAGMICGITNRQGTLVAAALFGQSKGTHYYLAPAMNEEGRETRSMFHLIDRYIHLHAGLPVTLDFEGSDIESVARFYKGFGARPEFYSSLRINRLPWPLNSWADRRIK